jgi:hypothetical protein
MTSTTAHKMFKVLCNVHFCMFLYVYDLFHILLSCDKIMDPWNVCMFVCMYVHPIRCNINDSTKEETMMPSEG